jgi:hypothetical protein
MAENRTRNLYKHTAGLLTTSLCPVREYQTNLEIMGSINQRLVTSQPSKTFGTSNPCCYVKWKVDNSFDSKMEARWCMRRRSKLTEGIEKRSQKQKRTAKGLRSILYRNGDDSAAITKPTSYLYIQMSDVPEHRTKHTKLNSCRRNDFGTKRYRQHTPHPTYGVAQTNTASLPYIKTLINN